MNKLTIEFNDLEMAYIASYANEMGVSNESFVHTVVLETLVSIDVEKLKKPELVADTLFREAQINE